MHSSIDHNSELSKVDKEERRTALYANMDRCVEGRAVWGPCVGRVWAACGPRVGGVGRVSVHGWVKYVCAVWGVCLCMDG
jgi:hypothetical protein